MCLTQGLHLHSVYFFTSAILLRARLHWHLIGRVVCLSESPTPRARPSCVCAKAHVKEIDAQGLIQGQLYYRFIKHAALGESIIIATISLIKRFNRNLKKSRNDVTLNLTALQIQDQGLNVPLKMIYILTYLVWEIICKNKQP